MQGPRHRHRHMAGCGGCASCGGRSQKSAGLPSVHPEATEDKKPGPKEVPAAGPRDPHYLHTTEQEPGGPSNAKARDSAPVPQSVLCPEGVELGTALPALSTLEPELSPPTLLSLTVSGQRRGKALHRVGMHQHGGVNSSSEGGGSGAGVSAEKVRRNPSEDLPAHSGSPATHCMTRQAGSHGCSSTWAR